LHLRGQDDAQERVLPGEQPHHVIDQPEVDIYVGISGNDIASAGVLALGAFLDVDGPDEADEGVGEGVEVAKYLDAYDEPQIAHLLLLLPHQQ
jgi:hypothetical protein